MANQIKRLGSNELTFDKLNPRMVEFTGLSDEAKIINALWQNMAVNEIVMSILANGFFENEAMYAVKEDDKYVVVEGNRRLAAVRAILDPDIIRNGGMNKYRERITPAIISQLKSNLPVVVLNNREEAWRYIGFKHVNGAVKWDSFAKAEYIAQVHNTFGVPLESIAEQIGDSNRTTLKLYQGLMVLEQAERFTHFNREDKYYSKLYFSHLYTAIGYEGYQKFLSLDSTKLTENPVPESHYKELEEVMTWIFGSKEQDLKPIIRSQNPDIRKLNQVLLNPESVQLLRARNDFDVAFDNSQNGINVLFESIMAARADVQKALSKLDFYDGREDVLQSVMTLANQTDALFESMKALYKVKQAEKKPVENKRSID